MKYFLVITILCPSLILANDLSLMNVIAAPTYTYPAGSSEIEVFKPGSKEQIELFEMAANELGLPDAWAHSKGLQSILEKEGYTVGQPNYTYDNGSLARELGVDRLSSPRNGAHWPKVWESLIKGQIRAKSTACGLGQLINLNVDAFLQEYHQLGKSKDLAPYRRKYYGNPLMEACGMLWYIKGRYGTPTKAWKQYRTKFNGY